MHLNLSILASTFVTVLGISIATTPAAMAQSVTGIRYDVTFDSSSAASNTIKVAMSFMPNGATGPISLSLPAWTPGAYEITDFAKWVSNFSPTQNGKAIKWDKTDYDTWRVRPVGKARVTVSFDFVADSLDTAMSWSQPDFLMFNGTNIFMYPEGQGFAFPSTVVINTHRGWNVATGMSGSSTTRTYTSSNYHDLVDMPFFVGLFDVDSAQVSNTWVRYATYPQGSVAGEARAKLWSDIQRMIPPQVAVFGEVPWKDYTIMQIMIPTSGGGGLEHQNSHVDIVPPGAQMSPVLPSLYAHEIFHAWNVKRLRPSELWPYRYDKAQPTGLLWISEGITDYYADISEVRGGIITKNDFYNLTAGKVSEVENTPAVSLEDASLSTWIHPTDGTQYVYYPKGSLAGLLIDIMIRDASNNKASLDNVMRNLYRTTYKRGAGFTNTQFWNTVNSATGGVNAGLFKDFYSNHIDGREPFPYTQVLKLGGIKIVTDTIREPRLGVSTGSDSAGVYVMAVIPNGAAESAGVKAGDYIVGVGNIEVSDPSFSSKFRDAYVNAAPGTPLTIRVLRKGQVLALNGTIKFAERVQIQLMDDPFATTKAARIRDGLLSGR